MTPEGTRYQRTVEVVPEDASSPASFQFPPATKRGLSRVLEGRTRASLVEGAALRGFQNLAITGHLNTLKLGLKHPEMARI